MGKKTVRIQNKSRISPAGRKREKKAATTDYSKYDFSSGTQKYDIVLNKGLNEQTVRRISELKSEPDWMLQIRLKALKAFWARPMPQWGANLNEINFDDIIYYLRATKNSKSNWEDVPDYVKKTFDRIGVPKAEKEFLAGVGAQYDSEVIYHNIRKDLRKQGIIFLSMDEGLKQYPEIVKKHFASVVPINDNKFAALNTAVWSGGSFVFVPKGVKVDTPLQAYFRINGEQVGQFERTLIIAEEGSQIHYIEGCFTKGAPILCESGIKPIEEVTFGEKVWTHQNRWMPVYHMQVRTYSGNLNAISYYGDTRQSVQVTDEHPFLAVPRQRLEYKNTEWEPRWVKASELQKSDYLAIPIDRTIVSADRRLFSVLMGNGRGAFKQKELELETDAGFFRLIGYYLAEGTTLSGHYVTFTFNEKERVFLDDVKQLLERYFGKAPLEYPIYNHGISLVLCSTWAARFFNQQFNHHAHTKCLPGWVLHEAPEKQAELIKAYWRGDGSYMYQQFASGIKRMYRMNTVSEKLAEQIRNLLLRQNIFASINVQKRKGNRKTMHCLHVGGSFLYVFGKLVDAQIASETLVGNQVGFQVVQQKQLVSFANVTEKYAFVPIKKIEKQLVKETRVYNFSVKEDESYVANGIVVHNCSAPKFTTQSLHAAVVELIAKKNSYLRYTTIQNWATNIYNLVTKRAFVYENASVYWTDGNLGSRVTSKYPAIFLMEEGAKGEVLSVALAGKGQHQDTGAKAVHLASNTTSIITSKSISKDGGRASYRGLLKVAKHAQNVKSTVRCDALLLDSHSRTDTYPYIEIDNPTATICHEATVGKIGEDQLFYLMSRGLSEHQALTLVVMGFIQPFTKSLPLEYAVELNRLIEMEMENKVG